MTVLSFEFVSILNYCNAVAHQFREALMLPATLFVATGLLISGMSALKAQQFERHHRYISFSGWSVSSGVYWAVTDIVSMFACGIYKILRRRVQGFVITG